MEYSKILEGLCSYDPRAPDYADYLECIEDTGETPKKPRDNCYCDSCFRGNDDLAVALLEALELLENCGYDPTDLSCPPLSTMDA